DESTESDKYKYKVYRKRSGIDTSFALVGQPIATANPTISFLDTTVHATNQVVYYYIIARDGIGYESLASVTIKIVAGDSTRPTAPTVQATAGDAQVALAWDASTDDSDVVGTLVCG